MVIRLVASFLDRLVARLVERLVARLDDRWIVRLGCSCGCSSCLLFEFALSWCASCCRSAVNVKNSDATSLCVLPQPLRAFQNILDRLGNMLVDRLAVLFVVRSVIRLVNIFKFACNILMRFLQQKTWLI